MALQVPFFMAPEDERDVLRRLSGLRLELWPELTEPQHRPPLCGEETQLVDPAVYFFRSQLDEEGQLRSGYFWAETETGGDQSRIGGKPSRFLRAVRELQEAVKSRFRRSSPVKGTIYFVGPAAARLAQAGTPLREAGRKGELVRVFR